MRLKTRFVLHFSCRMQQVSRSILQQLIYFIYIWVLQDMHQLYPLAILPLVNQQSVVNFSCRMQQVSRSILQKLIYFIYIWVLQYMHMTAPSILINLLSCLFNILTKWRSRKQTLSLWTYHRSCVVLTLIMIQTVLKDVYETKTKFALFFLSYEAWNKVIYYKIIYYITGLQSNCTEKIVAEKRFQVWNTTYMRIATLAPLSRTTC
jgi:hypothetical protein